MLVDRDKFRECPRVSASSPAPIVEVLSRARIRSDRRASNDSLPLRRPRVPVLTSPAFRSLSTRRRLCVRGAQGGRPHVPGARLRLHRGRGLVLRVPHLEEHDVQRRHPVQRVPRERIPGAAGPRGEAPEGRPEPLRRPHQLRRHRKRQGAPECVTRRDRTRTRFSPDFKRSASFLSRRRRARRSFATRALTHREQNAPPCAFPFFLFSHPSLAMIRPAREHARVRVRQPPPAGPGEHARR